VDEPPELRRPTRRQAYRRRLVALVLVLAVVGASAWAALAMVGSRDKAAPEPTTTVAAPKILRVLFPEGFTRAQMAARAHRVSPAIGVSQYLRATASSTLPGIRRRRQAAQPRGLPLPRDVRDLRRLAGGSSGQEAAGRLLPELGEGQPPLCALKEPDALRRPDDRLDDREGGRRAEGTPARRSGDLQPPARADAARHRRHAPLRARHPADQAITKTDLASDSPYNTRRFPGLPPTPIANPVSPRSGGGAPAKVDYLYFVRSPDCRSHFFTASIEEFDSYTRKGLTNC
jgi:hypothetical protein